MPSKAQEQFDRDYLFVRKELVSGRSPFVDVATMKDWINHRVEQVVNQAAKERWGQVRRSMLGIRADRELEAYHALLRFNGEKEEDDD